MFLTASQLEKLTPSALAVHLNASNAALAAKQMTCEITNFVYELHDIGVGSLFFAFSEDDYRDNFFSSVYENSPYVIFKALQLGALACVIRDSWFQKNRALFSPYAGQLIIVADAMIAYQTLASLTFQSWNRPVVGITGSAGKTTTKDLVIHILEHVGKRVLGTRGNQNNGLGVPKTLLRLRGSDTFDVAVLEMGMSMPGGEIRRLCEIVPPSVATILNVLPVHLEKLGSIENISEAKSEMVLGMQSKGTAVLNRDDARVWAMRSLAPANVLSFGMHPESQITASSVEFHTDGSTSFQLSAPDCEVRVRLQMGGMHSVRCALAAVAICSVFHVQISHLKEALATAIPSQNRGRELYFENGCRVIDDTYNSNPDALLAAVESMTQHCRDAKRKIVIAGEMAELGANSQAIHFEVGRKIARDIDVVWGIAGDAHHILEGARAQGVDDVVFFEDSQTAAVALGQAIRSGDAILLKGSRKVHMEQIVKHLLATYAQSIGSKN